MPFAFAVNMVLNLPNNNIIIIMMMMIIIIIIIVIIMMVIMIMIMLIITIINNLNNKIEIPRSMKILRVLIFADFAD